MNELRPPFAGRNPLFGAALIAIAGITLAEFFDGNLAWPLGALGFLLIAFLRTRRLVFAWLVLAASFYALHLFNLRPPSALALASRLGSNPTLVRATGLIIDEPRNREPSRFYRFTLQLEEIVIADTLMRCRAQVVVAWPKMIHPSYGDRIEVTWFRAQCRAAAQPGASSTWPAG